MKVIWDLLPGWIKWPVLILVTPTFLISSYVSWHTNDIHATVGPKLELKDEQIKSIGSDIKDIKEDMKIIKDYLINN